MVFYGLESDCLEPFSFLFVIKAEFSDLVYPVQIILKGNIMSVFGILSKGRELLTHPFKSACTPFAPYSAYPSYVFQTKKLLKMWLKQHERVQDKKGSNVASHPLSLNTPLSTIQI